MGLAMYVCGTPEEEREGSCSRRARIKTRNEKTVRAVRLTEIGQQVRDGRVAVRPVVGHDPVKPRHVHQRLSEPHELGHLFASRVRGRDEVDEDVVVAVVARRATLSRERKGQHAPGTVRRVIVL